MKSFGESTFYFCGGCGEIFLWAEVPSKCPYCFSRKIKPIKYKTHNSIARTNEK